jgi:phosphopantothenoylcysteine decarboxylase/phosphopantothenate--cysteine ligase
MHPSKDILNKKGEELKGKRIALCITGSVAAIRCPEFARELMRHGGEVKVVMSPAATRIISPELMHWATGEPVVTELTGAIEHVELAQWADLIAVVPATANTVGKIASAIDDTPVTSVVSVSIGLKKQVAVAPAMHSSMYSHPGVQENLAHLRELGVGVLEPHLREDKAKLPSIVELVEWVIGLLTPKDLAGLRILVTAGPTVEPIDPVKIITNRSSGKMGIALARSALNRGAEVTLVYGPGTEEPPSGVKLIRVESTQEMLQAVKRELKAGKDVLIATAAPQDLMVKKPFKKKLRHFEPVELDLVPAPRVIGDARRIAPKTYLVGFKAEYQATDEELTTAAGKKMKENKLDMVVANDVSRPGVGFGSDKNEVIIITPSFEEKVAGSKDKIADKILDLILKKMSKK